jgi:amino acid transporter
VDYLSFAKPDAAEASAMPLGLVFSGATLAFFAFIGFEDMVNLSEEVRSPERNVPLAICFAIVITSVIYVLISLVTVSVVSPAALGDSRSPLIEVVRRAAPGFPLWVYSVVPAFAVLNTALFNLMMASRLVFGMARHRSGVLPRGLAQVHPRFRTPIAAVVLGAAITAVLVLATRDLSKLASGTTAFLLAVFLLLHGALLWIKTGRVSAPEPRFRIPAFLPVLGALSCLVLLVRQSPISLLVAGVLVLVALLLYAVARAVRGQVDVETVD